MHILLKILKITGIVLASFLGFILLYLLFALLLSVIPTSYKDEGMKEVEIFVQTNGVHSDIVMPVRFDSLDWSKTIPFSDTKGKDTAMKYISLGWGDKGFYLNTPTWSELKVSTALKAAFGLGGSAMHVTFYKAIDPSCSVRLKISRKRYFMLAEFVRKSFVTDARGNFIFIPTNMVYGKDDAFYEARGSYSLFKTCNSWTNRALKKAGQKACLWTPVDKGIFYQYRNNKGYKQ